MELRGQDKVIGRMPSTLTYTPPPHRDSSSSKLSSSPDFPSAGHHGNNTTLFTHPPHQTLDRSRRDPDPTPDPTPTPTPVIVTPSAATTIASGSNFKAPPAPPQPPPSTAASRVRYRECLKNHAASSGGHVLDGCGEFMPGGDEDTPGSLKCAACECHRNFHRKEIDGEHVSNNYYVINQQQNSRRDSAITRLPVLISTPPSLPVHHSAARGPSPAMMMTFGSSGGVAAESSSEDLNMNNNLFRGANYAADAQGSKKRFRTKFSQEQKEKMTEVAEKLGWRIQKHDEHEVEKLCSEVGIKRQVFKVWMHNNKQAMKKKKMLAN